MVMANYFFLGSETNHHWGMENSPLRPHTLVDPVAVVAKKTLGQSAKYP
jgi:hypothetical protein